MNDQERMTGKTTGLMLIALGKASLAKGEEVEFIDHNKHTYKRAARHKYNLRAMAYYVGLKVVVRRDRSRVFIRSTLKRTQHEASK